MDIQQRVFTEQNCRIQKDFYKPTKFGINWDIESDNLSLLEINKSFIPIKRGVLSVLCSIYYALDFISPCILGPKLIVQECWKRNLN